MKIKNHEVTTASSGLYGYIKISWEISFQELAELVEDINTFYSAKGHELKITVVPDDDYEFVISWLIPEIMRPTKLLGKDVQVSGEGTFQMFLNGTETGLQIAGTMNAIVNKYSLSSTDSIDVIAVPDYKPGVSAICLSWKVK